MIVCLGTEGAILPQERADRITSLLWQIVSIHERLWERDGHSRADLLEIDDAVVAMLTDFKEEWVGLSKSDCRFPKYHYTLHLTDTIVEMGSMRVVDTCFGESKNKVVKKIYRRTNRKQRNLETQMFHRTNAQQNARREARRYSAFDIRNTQALIVTSCHFVSLLVTFRHLLPLFVT